MAKRYERALLLIGSLLLASAEGAERYPLSYSSCGQSSRIERSPERAMSLDINTTEIMLRLGLAPKMTAIAGVSDRKLILPSLQAEFARIAKVDASYPSLEAVVATRADFIFGGWQYGFSESTGLTPQRLAKYGIKSYALSESCIRIQTRPKISMEDVFVDIATIGKVFGRQKEAEALIADFRSKLDALRHLPKRRSPPRIFLYDSGEASPFTAGRYAIPNAMIEAIGALNIFDDVNSSWTGVSWEDVIARKPDFVIIVDYGDKTADHKIRFLEAKFRDKALDMMTKKRYIVLPYAAVTPGIRSVAATEELMAAVDRFYPRPVR